MDIETTNMRVIHLFSLFVWNWWLSWRIIFNSTWLKFILSNVWLDRLLHGTISRIIINEMHLWLFKQLNNWMHSPIFTLVTYWYCSLPVGTCTAAILNYIVRIVICIRFGSISIGFIWNSCFAIKLNKILMSLKSSFNYWIYIFRQFVFKDSIFIDF